MLVTPVNGYILCEKVVQEQDSEVFIYNKESLPLYKIIQIYKDHICEKFEVGDIIVTNSIPTEINVSDTIKVYLIKEEYISCKIKN